MIAINHNDFLEEEMEKFVKLGTYVTNEGLEYDCEFIPVEKIAIAIGPLPRSSENCGCRKADYEVIAKTKEEAREALKESIGVGYFK